jgi:hypothetical protein
VAIWLMNGIAILSGAIVANVFTDGQSKAPTPIAREQNNAPPGRRSPALVAADFCALHSVVFGTSRPIDQP